MSNVETYLLPCVKNLFAYLSGGQKLTFLDMSQAYLQLPVKDK